MSINAATLAAADLFCIHGIWQFQFDVGGTVYVEIGHLGIFSGRTDTKKHQPCTHRKYHSGNQSVSQT